VLTVAIYSSSGGATKKEPSGGWLSHELADILSSTPLGPQGVSTPSANSHIAVSTIIGSTVGVFVGIVVLGLLCR